MPDCRKSHLIFQKFLGRPPAGTRAFGARFGASPSYRPPFPKFLDLPLVSVAVSTLDYCNSLLYDASDGLIQKLQSVQKAAARLITGASRCDRISHVLVQLHWLPACPVTSGVQNCMPRASVVVRSNAGILNWRYQLCRSQWSSPSQILSRQDLRSTMHPHSHNRPTYGDRVSLLLVRVCGTYTSTVKHLGREMALMASSNHSRASSTASVRGKCENGKLNA